MDGRVPRSSLQTISICHFAMPQHLGAPRETNPALTRRAQVFPEEKQGPSNCSNFISDAANSQLILEHTSWGQARMRSS
jgi:hypothetical protein